MQRQFVTDLKPRKEKYMINTFLWGTAWNPFTRVQFAWLFKSPAEVNRICDITHFVSCRDESISRRIDRNFSLYNSLSQPEFHRIS